MWLRRISYAARTLRRQPANTLLSFLAFAIGIGLCTGMFNILSGMVLRALPFPDEDRLYAVSYAREGRTVWLDGFTYEDFLDVRQRQTAFEELAGMVGDGRVYADPGGPPETMEIGAVSREFFQALDVRPVRGRVFGADADRAGGAPVALISHRLWTGRYNGDDVLGRTVLLDGVPSTIVGVLPQGFDFPWNAQVLIPLHRFPGLMTWDNGAIYAFGRLRADRSLAQANAAMNALFEARRETSSDPSAELPPQIRPLAEVMGHPLWNQVAWLMMLAVVLVLAVACLNVANLRLMRALQRSTELKVRAALGAPAHRLVGLVVTETALLAVAGAAGGAVVAHFCKRMFENALAGYPDLVWWRYLWDFSVDGRTLVFTTLAVGASCLAASAIPVWFVLRRAAGPRAAGSTEGVASSRIGSALVVGQVALTFLLLTGAGLMIKTVLAVSSEPLPYDPQRILLARIGVQPGAFADDTAHISFWRAVQERARQLSGVESASLTNRQHHWESWRTTYVRPEHQFDPGAHRTVLFEIVSPAYFDTLGAPILEGRALNAADDRGRQPVAVVNRSFAEKNWPGQSALGKTFLPGSVDLSGTPHPPTTVVGVVGDLRMEGVRRRSILDGAGFYLPYTQARSGTEDMTLQLRTRTAPASLARQLRVAMHALDPELVVTGAKSIALAIAEDTTDRRLVRDLFTVFGAVSVFLAGLGIFGVVSTSVTRRRREFGVRMAIGAHRGDVLGSVLRHTLTLCVVGLSLGLGSAFVGGRFLSSFLYGVSAQDTGIWAIVGMALTAVALLAAILPAHRASRIEPVSALRSE